MEVFAVPSKVEDWVNHQLIWAVKRYVSATIGSDHFDAPRFVLVASQKEVLLVKTGAQGQHRGMFDEYQSVVA